MTHLTREQRYAIYLGRQAKRTQKQIADEIGVSQSTVSRELRRGSKGRGGYNWLTAQEKAETRKSRTPGNRCIDSLVLWEALHLLQTRQWSPEQISGHLARHGRKISHETIYKHIRANPDKYARFCHHHMRYKRKRKAEPKPTKATNIPNRVSIHQRPPEADGNRFGDWEMDLIVDYKQNAILSLVERSTDMQLIEKLPEGKRAMPLARAVYRLLLPFKEHLHSITTDNGSEFAAHEFLTKKLNVPVFFADSYASWQKGNVENANKLVRFYLPKGTDFDTVSNATIHKIQRKLNSRPRKKLDFSTPLKEFFKHFL
ncbi:MAG: IS30 family transposase [Muribaculaceae bacterium]|nr:IS30 family transposase [Muribaculaceae bacterium]